MKKIFITASLLVARSVVAAAAKWLTDEALAAIDQHRGKLAWLVLRKAGCESVECNVFGKLWDEAHAQYPDDIMWKVECGSKTWHTMEVQHLCRRLVVENPTTVVVLVHGWSQDPNRVDPAWEMYTGSREIQVLVDSMKRSVDEVAASRRDENHKTRSQMRPLPDPEAFSQCLTKSFHEAIVSSASASSLDSGAGDANSESLMRVAINARSAKASGGAEEDEAAVDDPDDLPGWDSELPVDLEVAFDEIEHSQPPPLPPSGGGLRGACAHDEAGCENGERRGDRRQGAPLRPVDVPDAPVFDAYTSRDMTRVGQRDYEVHKGAVRWGGLQRASEFDVVKGIVTRDEVAALRGLVESHEGPFDSDPDTVDAMATHEIFIRSPDLASPPARAQTMQPMAKGDHDPQIALQRGPLRKALEKALRPIIDERITPYVQERYRAQCGAGRPKSRRCTACYALVRRYLPHERRSHEPHYDGHALVSVVVSLADFGTEYDGGLIIKTAKGNQVIKLSRGDAIVHQSDLYHGVRVNRGERWSLIIWYRDSSSCAEFGYQWFEKCAREGDPMCQAMHASKVGMTPHIAHERAASQVLEWNRRSAEGGFAYAMVRVARAYLKRLPSTLPYDPAKAASWFRKGILAAADGESHYGLAQMLLDNQTRPDAAVGEGEDESDVRVSAAVRAFEGAALHHHRFAAFNLGIAHLHGHGHLAVDADLAAEWFMASGLPEGFWGVATHRELTGRLEEAREWKERARRMGFLQPWRKMAIERTGSGGASGVSLHSTWPGGRLC